MGIIYMHTSKTTRMSYIGRTIFDINNRFKKHIQDSNAGSMFEFHIALRTYGVDDFDSVIIEDMVSNDTISERERYWINYYNTYHLGYNMSNGGSAGLYNDKSKEKMRKTLSVIESNGKQRSVNNAYRRVKLMKQNDPDIYVKIGKKSSNTQIRNGKSKGWNNANINTKKILLIDSLGDVQLSFYRININSILSKKYPSERMILWSLINKKPMYMANPPRIKSKYDFKGWCVCYEDEIWTYIDVCMRDTNDKPKKNKYVFKIYNSDGVLEVIVSNKDLKKYCIVNDLKYNQFQYSYRQKGKRIKSGTHKNWYCIKERELL